MSRYARYYHVCGSILLFITALSTTAAHAEGMPAPAQNGVYIGGQYGYAHTGYTENNRKLAPASTDRHGGAGRFNVGYQFSPNLAVETGYTYYPETDFENVLATPGADVEIKQRTVDLLAKFSVPIGHNFDMFATLGAAYVQLDGHVNGAAKALGLSSTGFNNEDVVPTYSAGVAFHFTSELSGEVSWNRLQRFAGSTTRTSDMIVAGLTYRFFD